MFFFCFVTLSLKDIHFQPKIRFPPGYFVNNKNNESGFGWEIFQKLNPFCILSF